MGAGSAPHVMHPAATVSRKSHIFGQVLMLYAAVVSASTPVAMRYLYRTEQPPVPAVLAAVQTGLAAAILCVLCGSWWLLSGLRGGVGGPKAGARAPRQGLRDAEAPQHDDSASSIKAHEVRVLHHVLPYVPAGPALAQWHAVFGRCLGRLKEPFCVTLSWLGRAAGGLLPAAG